MGRREGDSEVVKLPRALGSTKTPVVGKNKMHERTSLHLRKSVNLGLGGKRERPRARQLEWKR